ncbi:hypothetical protein CRUP_036711 [Coryphaenoides rupestris]|nr:hypothetical protein CRUP_036711 [Coryphaenoides rupestris]
MAFSTSSPSLSSMSSMTPSSPEKGKKAEGNAAAVGLTFWGSEHERLNKGIENVTKKLEEVVKVRAAEVKEVITAAAGEKEEEEEREEEEEEVLGKLETPKEVSIRPGETPAEKGGCETSGEIGARRGGPHLPQQPTLSDMTMYEMNFSLLVEDTLQSIVLPEYRQIIVELLMVVSIVLERNPELEFAEKVDLGGLVKEAFADFQQDRGHLEGKDEQLFLFTLALQNVLQ